MSVAKTDAERTKRLLMEKKLLAFSHLPLVTADRVVFPLLAAPSDGFPPHEIVPFSGKGKERKTLQEEFDALLTPDERHILKTSFDVIGSIAILEMDEGLLHKEKQIAQVILDHHKNITTVLKKAGIHDGVFRAQPMAFLAGVDTRETVHKENGVRLKLDVEKVYFSPRLSTERERILAQIRDGEKILCLFSGCGPYPITFAKHKAGLSIVSIEINPLGITYQKENVKLNRIRQGVIEVIEGDVKKVLTPVKGTFDRIAMPLPKDAEDFLVDALPKAHAGTVVHLYDFVHEEKLEEKKKQVLEKVRSLGYEGSFDTVVKCGQYAPREHRICYDIRITKTP